MYDSILSMDRTSSSQAFTELILEIFRLNGRLLSAGDALTRPRGQTSARWQVLGALDDNARTVADIGRRMGLTRQSVQRTADLLEADGLLAYGDNPAHQRAKLAMLTPRGRATLDAITTRQIEWANRIASRLAENDLQRAIYTLQRVRQALDASEMPHPVTKRARLSGTVHRASRRTKRRSSS
jgi:DNA-binding MarR family transcriptional regulator